VAGAVLLCFAHIFFTNARVSSREFVETTNSLTLYGAQRGNNGLRPVGVGMTGAVLKQFISDSCVLVASWSRLSWSLVW
jgi:hypothetical protein